MGSEMCIRDSARTVWQLADVHLQLSYAEGASIFARCLRERRFGARAPASGGRAPRGGGGGGGGGGVPRWAFGAAGPFGDDYCDSPPRLLDEALAHINASHATSVDRSLRPLVLLTGDLVMSGAGGRSPVSDEAVLAAPEAVAAALARHLPAARVFPLWGNHDLLPYNTHTGAAGAASLAVQRAFAPWAGDVAARELGERGYYAVDLSTDLGLSATHAESQRAPRVLLIALNTVLFSPSNSAAHSADGLLAARAHLGWLGDHLRKLNASGGSAILAGHEPPGADWYTSRERRAPVESWWIPAHAFEYARLVSRHAAVVALQAFGHTHADEVRIVAPPSAAGTDDGGTRAGGDHDGGANLARTPAPAAETAGRAPEPTVAFVAPPLTPYGSAFNPAVRAYAFDVRARGADGGGGAGSGARSAPRLLQLRDFTQWVLLLESSNALNRSFWQVEYSATRAYGLADMSARSWLAAIGRMHEPRSVELLRYVAHANVWDQGRERFHSIDGARAMLCGAQHVEPGAFARCRDDATGALRAPPRARHGDVLPSAGSLEDEGRSAMFPTLPRGVTLAATG